MTLSSVAVTVPDALRLVALPVFAWAAWKDAQTRRIPGDVWIPLSILGAVLLAWDGWVAWNAGGLAWTREFLLPAGISLGFVVPIAYLFWWLGGFGGADAKALMVLALLFPVFPSYAIGSVTLPLEPTAAGAFSFSILTNAVLVGVCIPIVLAARNALAGRFTAVMVIGWPVSWEGIPETHGKLLERADDPSPRFSRGGLDLDALRMYLRWRGLSLAALRADPDHYRDPATLPAEPNPPTDGAVDADLDGPDPVAGSADEPTGTDRPSDASDASSGDEFEDPWGAEAFLEAIDGTAYGTSPETLRDGLEVLAREDTVWISPGTPFLVPVFVGLVLAVGYGDLLIGLAF